MELEVKKGIKCPECGAEIQDVTEVSIDFRNLGLSAMFGAGWGLMLSSIWEVNAWAIAGVCLVASVAMFGVMSVVGSARK